MWKRNPYRGTKSGLFQGVGGFSHRQHRKQSINRGARKWMVDFKKRKGEVKEKEMVDETPELI